MIGSQRSGGFFLTLVETFGENVNLFEKDLHVPLLSPIQSAILFTLTI